MGHPGIPRCRLWQPFWTMSKRRLETQIGHAQLHELKMTPGTTAEDYTAQFEMLAGRTSFNNKVIEDAYIRGLPHSILQKVFAQTTLPKGLEEWKTVIGNLDRLHQGLMELKRSTAQPNLS